MVAGVIVCAYAGHLKEKQIGKAAGGLRIGSAICSEAMGPDFLRRVVVLGRDRRTEIITERVEDALEASPHSSDGA